MFIIRLTLFLVNIIVKEFYQFYFKHIMYRYKINKI